MARIRQVTTSIEDSFIGPDYLALRTVIELSGGRIIQNQTQHRKDDFQTHFDLIWEDMGHSFKRFVKENPSGHSTTNRGGGR